MKPDDYRAIVGTSGELRGPHGARLARGYFLVLGLIAANGLVTSWNLQEMARGRAELARCFRVQLIGQQLLTGLEGAETGQRGYLLTGDESYLESYHRGREAIEGALARLSTIAGDDGPFRRIAPDVTGTAAAKLDELDETIRLRRGGDETAALSLMKTGRGKALMDDLRRSLGRIDAEEEARSDAIQARQDALVQRTFATFGLASAVALGLLMLVHRTNRAMRRVLERSARWFATALRSVGDAVVATDPQGRVAFMNPPAEALTGWPMAEARGRPIEEVYRVADEETGEVVPARSGSMPTAGRGDDTQGRPHVLLARDGSGLPIEDRAAPIIAEDGATLGVVTVCRDVGESRRSRRLLEESERRFRRMANYAPVMIWTTGPDGGVTWFNRPWLEFTGGAMEQELGRGWIENVHPDDRPGCSPDGDAGRRDHGPFATEFRLRHRDGGYRWILSQGTPLTGPGGEFAGHIGSAIDLSARKEMEDRLRESEWKFRTLADTIPQLTWMARPDGSIFWYNRRWYEFTGMPPEQMEGWGWQSVHHPEVLPEVLRRWRASLTSGEPFDMVFPLRSREGDYHHFLTRVVPLRDDRGRIQLWFGTNTDITEQRGLQERLRDNDRRKDDFLAMLAHELRNPLAPLKNAAFLLAHGAGAPELVDEAGQMISRQVDHMARLLDDLLDVSRITRGKVVLKKERLDLARHVRAVVGDRSAAIEEAGLCLRLDAADTPVWVHADPTRLTQILGNLLDNARKFTERGGHIAVEVKIAADPDAGGPGSGDESNPGSGGPRAVLTVRDTGIGIDPSTMPVLFEPFTQADKSLNRSRGGLGLGLAFVKGMVALHAGTVEARSEGPGRGAEFTVRLPLLREAAALDPGPSKPRPAVATAGRLKILVVEDNRDATLSLALLLEAQGHHVTVASSGPEALDLVRDEVPDVIVCDIGLPGMDGYAVARAIRSNRATRRARLIAVTGYGQEADRARALASGFDSHLTKPADPVQLLGLMAQ